ncbi:hypothetical protein LUZ60_012826 [Juncus effusus]|nr:hypothetical protein LUZ60_012826 [Juncus effusus]
MRQLSISLILKLTAAIASGTAAILTLHHFRRDDTILTLHRDIYNASWVLSKPAPPTILIIGSRGHGKSSFLNTVCRTLAGETGPLLLRAESRPPGGESVGDRKKIVHAKVEGIGENIGELEELVVRMVEKGLRLEETKENLEAVIRGDEVAECVVVVVRCSSPAKERCLAVRRLADIANAIRDRGLHLIVVLTNKKSIKTSRQAEELWREVAFRARTDCVYFIENYTSSNSSNLRHPPVIKNEFDTHFTVLTIVRQCLEFTKLYRSQLKNVEKDASRPN